MEINMYLVEYECPWCHKPSTYTTNEDVLLEKEITCIGCGKELIIGGYYKYIVQYVIPK